jgi:predicted SprT family Zn-dependent metalloprotease
VKAKKIVNYVCSKCGKVYEDLPRMVKATGEEVRLHVCVHCGGGLTREVHDPSWGKLHGTLR